MSFLLGGVPRACGLGQKHTIEFSYMNSTFDSFLYLGLVWEPITDITVKFTPRALMTGILYKEAHTLLRSPYQQYLAINSYIFTCFVKNLRELLSKICYVPYDIHLTIVHIRHSWFHKPMTSAFCQVWLKLVQCSKLLKLAKIKSFNIFRLLYCIYVCIFNCHRNCKIYQELVMFVLHKTLVLLLR